jgi:hypothetical protein
LALAACEVSVQKYRMPNSAVNELDRLLVTALPLQREYAKVRTASEITDLSRTELFYLMKMGKIAFVHYRRPGAEKGIRLIELNSLRAFLESLKQPSAGSKGSKVNPKIKL